MKELIGLVVFGLGNKLFSIFQTLPMHDFPIITNLWTQFMFSFLCLFYIVPMKWFGNEIGYVEYNIPKKPFLIMGILDGIASVSSQIAINYIYKSSLVPLLQQASLPFSLIASRLIVKQEFKRQNVIGSIIVFFGISIVLIPGLIYDKTKSNSGSGSELNLGFELSLNTTLNGVSDIINDDDIIDNQEVSVFWCIVLVLSCIPSVVSSAYKERFLNSNRTVNLMYVNFWVSVFQFVFVFPMLLTIPILTGNSIRFAISRGFPCLFGVDSNNNSNKCRTGLIYVNLYIVFNFVYNIYLILVLKKESNSILWLASTLIIPFSQIVLWIPGIPRHSRFSVFDLLGLFVIVFGMVVYRRESEVQFYEITEPLIV